MPLPRRTLLTAAFTTATRAQPTLPAIRIGMLTDLSGRYRADQRRKAVARW